MAAVGAGLAVAARPAEGLAVVAALPVVALLLSSSTFRLITVIGGALLVFGSTSVSAKIGYLAVALVCVAAAIVRLIRAPGPLTSCFRPMFLADVVFLGVLTASAFNSAGHGVPLTSWFRDALPYLMIVILPIVGLDSGSRLHHHRVNQLIAAIGLLTAFGFAVQWLTLRGVGSFGLARIILSTGTLPGMVFAFALAHARPRRAARWLVVAALIATFLLITGTRTNILIAVAFLGIIGRRRFGAQHPARAIVFAVLLPALTVAMLFTLARVVLTSDSYLVYRFHLALQVLGGAHDQSYEIRQAAYGVARTAFFDNRWLGTGPGFLLGGGEGFTLDTPWVVLSKWGIVGVLALGGLAVGLMVSIGRARKLTGPDPVYVAARSWLLMLACWTPFTPWTEDKGFGMAIALLVAATASRHQASESDRNGIEDETGGLRNLQPGDSALTKFAPPESVLGRGKDDQTIRTAT